MKPFKIIKVKPIKLRFNFDSDRDKVPDWKDCQPFNPFKQDAEPNEQLYEEIKKLPIYVCDNEYFNPEKAHIYRRYHILSKEARSTKALNMLRKIGLSIIKRYPQIIGYMKKYRPTGLTFCEGISHSGAKGATSVNNKEIAIPLPDYVDATKKEAVEFLKQIKYMIPKKSYKHIKKHQELDVFLDESKETYKRKAKKSMGWTSLHELRHVKQLQDEDPEEFAEKYTEKVRTIKKQHEGKPEGLIQISHFNPYEIQAEEFAYQETKKREKKPRKDVEESFGAWYEREK